MAAALASGTGGGPQVPTALPGRLAGLLVARAGRCAGNARAVLDALAVAGRPLGEDLLGDIAGLETEVVRRGLRELAAARLLADDTTPGGGRRPRHALLAETVATNLLPGERADLHERTARALEATGGGALAGEAAHGDHDLCRHRMVSATPPAAAITSASLTDSARALPHPGALVVACRYWRPEPASPTRWRLTRRSTGHASGTAAG
jgi:hypothetical protein